MNFQKQGGYASIVLAGIIIVNTILLVVMFHGFTELKLDIYDPVKMMECFNTHMIAFLVYYGLGILTGVLVVFITLVLQERMKDGAPLLMRMAVVAASGYFIFAIAAEASGIYRNIVLSGINDPASFRTFLVLHECFGAASSHALGWAFLFIGWSTLRTHTFSRILGYIMLVYGIVDIVFSAIPFLLLLGLIVFLWLGIALLRDQEPDLATQETA